MQLHNIAGVRCLHAVNTVIHVVVIIVIIIIPISTVLYSTINQIFLNTFFIFNLPSMCVCLCVCARRHRLMKFVLFSSLFLLYFRVVHLFFWFFRKKRRIENKMSYVGMCVYLSLFKYVNDEIDTKALDK